MVCGNRREEDQTVSEYLILPIIVNSNLQCTINKIMEIYCQVQLQKYMLAYAYLHRIVATRDT